MAIWLYKQTYLSRKVLIIWGRDCGSHPQTQLPPKAPLGPTSWWPASPFEDWLMTPGLPVQTEQGTALPFMNGGRVDPRSGLLCKQKLPHFHKALLKYFGGVTSTLKFLRRAGGISQPTAKAQLLSLLRVNFTSGSSQCEAECKTNREPRNTTARKADLTSACLLSSYKYNCHLKLNR